jgi:acyl transferase domain-containing protein
METIDSYDYLVAPSTMPQVQVFLFSGETRKDLVAKVQSLRNFQKASPRLPLHDLAKHHFENKQPGPEIWRLALVSSDIDALLKQLELAMDLVDGDQNYSHSFDFYLDNPTDPGKLAFLFPGQGSQRLNMLLKLIQSCPGSRAAIKQADDQLSGVWDRPLSRFIYPSNISTEISRKIAEDHLHDTAIAQPALGAVDLTALDVLVHYGVYPDMVAGHSFGDFVALCAAGTLSRKDLFLVSRLRGMICSEVGRVNPRIMMAVRASPDAIEQLIIQSGMELRICNINSPTQVIIAGSPETIDKAIPLFTEQGIKAKRLGMPMAFHIPEMRAAAEQMLDILKEIVWSRAYVPVYLSTLASEFKGAETELKEIMAWHLIRPVLFLDTVNSMYKDGARFFLEVGPWRTLTNLATQILDGKEHQAMSIDNEERTGNEQLAHVLASLHVRGFSVDWNTWFHPTDLHETAPA